MSRGTQLIGSVIGRQSSFQRIENVDYVVVGEDPGSKLDKAQKLGLTIIDEEAFLKMVKENIMVKGGSLSKKVLSSLLIIALLTLCCPWFVSENSKAAAATYLYPKTLATDGEKLYVATDQGLLVWNGKVFSEVSHLIYPQ